MPKTTDGGASRRTLTDDQVPAFFGGVTLDPNNHDTGLGVAATDGRSAWQLQMP